ncbi:MAG: N-carbamoylputrescine amidase [Candidatus Ornithomonoglobus sp.]
MRTVTAAATQMSVSWDREAALEKAERIIREAHSSGADIVLLQELFETPYFCQKHKYEYFALASEPHENAAIKRFSRLAAELGIVIPVSFYEKHGNTAFNSIAVIDSDGELLGIYRKTHIPDGVPYAEKFYFTPGDTGFKVWETKFGRLGLGICWDQWFPEAARAMALMGAELLLYPTAIGSEPTLGKDSKDHWQNVMMGHAAANMVPVIASNRTGTEREGESEMTFYGSSFIADNHGCIAEEMDRVSEGFILHSFDLDALAKERREWGIYRDRRPEMYGILTTH